MIPVPSFIKSNLWKGATILAGIVSVVLIGLLIAANFENRDLGEQRAALSKQINDPETGFIARLAQSRTNEAVLKVAIERQKATFEAEAVKNNARLAETERQLAVAQRTTRDMEVRLRSYLSTGPQGATGEDQVRDIDARGLAEMVK